MSRFIFVLLSLTSALVTDDSCGRLAFHRRGLIVARTLQCGDNKMEDFDGALIVLRVLMGRFFSLLTRASSCAIWLFSTSQLGHNLGWTPSRAIQVSGEAHLLQRNILLTLLAIELVFATIRALLRVSIRVKRGVSHPQPHSSNSCVRGE